MDEKSIGEIADSVYTAVYEGLYDAGAPFPDGHILGREIERLVAAHIAGYYDVPPEERKARREGFYQHYIVNGGYSEAEQREIHDRTKGD